MTHAAAFAVQPELAALVEAQNAPSPEPQLDAIKVNIADEVFIMAGTTQVCCPRAEPALA
jgi:hypothetical protein